LPLPSLRRFKRLLALAIQEPSQAFARWEAHRHSGLVVHLDDLVLAAAALTPLTLRADDDPVWQGVAAPTRWTAAESVEHLTDALLFYCGQVARRADRRLPVLRDGRSAPPSEHLDNVVTATAMLVAQLRDLGPGRAWHPSGSADAAGWAGMAVTELLVHGVDAARALGLTLDLPADVCARTAARVFPWLDHRAAEPAALLLAVTGRTEVPGVPHDSDWWWQSAPLQEWNGHPRRRTTPPGWR
jgi:uncharacterized protein (TIGR03083 family)